MHLTLVYQSMSLLDRFGKIHTWSNHWACVWSSRAWDTFHEHLPVSGDRWWINIVAQTILSWTCRSVCWANLDLNDESTAGLILTSRDSRYCMVSHDIAIFQVLSLHHLHHFSVPTSCWIKKSLRFLGHFCYCNLGWKWMVRQTHSRCSRLFILGAWLPLCGRRFAGCPMAGHAGDDCHLKTLGISW